MRSSPATAAALVLVLVWTGHASAQFEPGESDEVQEGYPPRRGVIERTESEHEEVPPQHERTERVPEQDARDQIEFEDTELSPQLERGRYLAHSVAMCVICHSPKNEQGLPLEDRHFEGGVIPAKPTDPNMAPWADFAPALGPLVRGSEDEVLELLTTGIWPRTGRPPQPPMPPFRLSEEDAKAIVAYIKNLEP